MRAARPLALLLLLCIGAGCASTTPLAGGPQGQPGAASTPAGGPGQGATEPGAAGAPPAGEGWEKIREEDGIVVYKKEVEGSPLVAFRGEGIVQAPVGKVVAVLIDLTRTHEWVDRVVDAKLIRQISESEYVTYTHIGSPMIVSDREFLSRAKIDMVPGKLVRISMNATEDPDAPKTSHVRGELINSSWELTRLDADRTRVVAEIHADPKGSLPKMIVNLFQKGWAYKTITALRGQVAKTDIQQNPLMAARLKEHQLAD